MSVLKGEDSRTPTRVPGKHAGASKSSMLHCDVWAGRGQTRVGVRHLEYNLSDVQHSFGLFIALLTASSTVPGAFSLRGIGWAIPPSPLSPLALLYLLLASCHEQRTPRVHAAHPIVRSTSRTKLSVVVDRISNNTRRKLFGLTGSSISGTVFPSYVLKQGGPVVVMTASCQPSGLRARRGTNSH